MTETHERDVDRSSQTVKALLSLREMILSGALGAGERISELPMVERLGVSRTPVRHALVRLEEEGLLDPLPSGGFAVKAFSERDVFDAIETRGVLEGLGARLAAERGVTARALAAVKTCLTAIDNLIATDLIGTDAFAEYVRLNAEFHARLTALADAPVLARQIERAAALPFASPSGFVMAQSAMPRAGRLMIVAQDQHHAIVEAIEAGEGARAEAVTREHARLAARNLRSALAHQTSLDLVRGHALIKRRLTA